MFIELNSLKAGYIYIYKEIKKKKKNPFSVGSD